MRRARLANLLTMLLTGILILALSPAMANSQIRIGDLTIREGNIPRRLVGYGLVVGLDGTGDRSYGSSVRQTTPTVHSIVNLLRRFQVEVPAQYLRLRNSAAVLVTAEISPYLRAGGKFEVQVSAIGDAVSLRGGVLWMTPLLSDPNQPPLATAQGPLYVASEKYNGNAYASRTNTGRIPDGGILEVNPPTIAAGNRLHMVDPGLATATRIAEAINSAMGAGTAAVEDPGAILLTPEAATDTDANAFFAAIDTLTVLPQSAARIVIDAREGTVVTGGNVRVGAGVISHGSITLEITAPGSTPGATADGLVQVTSQASVQDIAAGLHAAGARPEEIAAIFEALRAAGSLRAQVIIR